MLNIQKLMEDWVDDLPSPFLTKGLPNLDNILYTQEMKKNDNIHDLMVRNTSDLVLYLGEATDDENGYEVVKREDTKTKHTKEYLKEGLKIYFYPDNGTMCQEGEPFKEKNGKFLYFFRGIYNKKDSFTYGYFFEEKKAWELLTLLKNRRIYKMIENNFKNINKELSNGKINRKALRFLGDLIYAPNKRDKDFYNDVAKIDKKNIYKYEAMYNSLLRKADNLKRQETDPKAFLKLIGMGWRKDNNEWKIYDYYYKKFYPSSELSNILKENGFSGKIK